MNSGEGAGHSAAPPTLRRSDTEERRKVALITGITGQDGSYLAEFLLSKGYEVHGLIRRSSSFNTGRIEHLYKNPVTHQEGSMKLHYGDMTDSSNLMKVIGSVRPSEIYNLAAQSHVKVSFDLPEYTAEVDAVGTIRLLDAIIACGLRDEVRFYQASTSELFGKVREIPQKETTPFYPRSPYGENFVTRKITRGVAKISLNQQECIELGNLNAKRDWGHARDYVEAMWMMLQLEKPDDFVISTGECHSVREFVELAFSYLGVTIRWEGSGVDEVGKDETTGAIRVRVNPKYYRPTEVELLIGDSTKAYETFKWKPKVAFCELVKEMVESDVKLMRSNAMA